MQHVCATSVDLGENDREAEPGGDDDDLSCQAHIAISVDEALVSLPPEGYYILDGRSSISLPITSHNYATGYVSFATFEGANISRIKQILQPPLKVMAKNWSNILLAFVPIGIVAPHIGCNDSVVFILNCIAVVPLADVLCRATDEVSTYMGETAGALLNVTMGNATEVVIFVHALLQRQYMIVRTSLLGSIVVNILLVLGLAVITSEANHRGLTYNILATRVAAGLLCLTAVSLLVPLTFRASVDIAKIDRDTLDLSRGVSIVLVVVYIIYLYTQLRSSKFAYKPLIELDPDTPDQPETIQISQASRLSFHRRTLSYPRDPAVPLCFEELPMYDSPCAVSKADSRISPLIMDKLAAVTKAIRSVGWVRKAVPIILLMISTGLISICGDLLVNSIDHFVDQSPLSKTMVGLILLPIVGNAAELVSSILFATRRQIDLAFAVSIGSALQIALFVTPLMVFFGWALKRDFALHFSVFEAVTLVASTVLFTGLVIEERCSALKGVCLCAGYTIIGLASYFVQNLE